MPHDYAALQDALEERLVMTEPSKEQPMDEQQQEAKTVPQRLQTFDSGDPSAKRTTIVMDGDDRLRETLLMMASAYLQLDGRAAECDELKNAAKRGWTAPGPIGGSVDSAANPDQNG